MQKYEVISAVIDYQLGVERLDLLMILALHASNVIWSNAEMFCGWKMISVACFEYGVLQLRD